jgi:hypothetical protein
VVDGFLQAAVCVSLTEDPEYEMDPCRRLAALGETACSEVGAIRWYPATCLALSRSCKLSSCVEFPRTKTNIVESAVLLSSQHTSKFVSW